MNPDKLTLKFIVLATTPYCLSQGSAGNNYGTLGHSIHWPDLALKAWAEWLRAVEALPLISPFLP